MPGFLSSSCVQQEVVRNFPCDTLLYQSTVPTPENGLSKLHKSFLERCRFPHRLDWGMHLHLSAESLDKPLIK